MKTFLLSILLLVSGLSVASEGQITKFREVVDSSGTHRLSLYYIGPEDRGFYFHSMVWDREVDGAWKLERTITSKEFESNTDQKRWVSDIHSFEPGNGIAIVRVAEGDTPKKAKVTQYIYSWRKWDLINNKQVQFIRECKSPLEPYSPADGIRLYIPYQKSPN